MKRLIAFLVLAVALNSCEMGVVGNGNVQTQKRSVETFNRVELSGMFEVYIRQGETPALTLKTDENLLELIETEVRSEELEIRSTKSIRKAKELAVYITVRELESIEISGAASIITEGELRSAKLELQCSGACEANMDLKCDELNIDVSGAAELNLQGIAEQLDIRSSGACEINAFELKTLKTKVNISGAGEVDVYVSEDLRVDASGAAEVRYKGTPRNISQEASGASSVKPYTR